MPASLAAALFGVLCFFTLTAGYLAVHSLRSAGANGDARASDTVVARRRVPSTGFARRIDERLARANLGVDVAQFLALVLLGSVLLGGAFLLMPPHHPAQLLVGVVCGVVVARWITARAARRRLERFTEALPDALDLLASSLRTGQPIRAGLELVAREMPDPLGAEFARVVREIELGQGEIEALESLAERLDSLDVQMLVTSIGVQKEVGGNLAEILTTLANTMRARFKILGQVDAYTAQARLSAKVLVALPLVFAAVLYTIRPGYLGVLLSDPIGHVVLVGAVLAWLAGWFLIRMILAVKV